MEEMELFVQSVVVPDGRRLVRRWSQLLQIISGRGATPPYMIWIESLSSASEDHIREVTK